MVSKTIKPNNKIQTLPHKLSNTAKNLENTVANYEKLSKTSAEKMLVLAKSEQDHRHRWENNYLKVMAANHRIGQLLMFVLAIIIVYSSIAFVMVHNQAVAILVVLAGFGFLSIQCVQNSKSRRYFDKDNKPIK